MTGEAILALWTKWSARPMGTSGFSWALGRAVPYSGSIRPRVLELSPGFARVALKERFGVRNHLGSIHAVALTNLGELASGLALLTSLPKGVRGIPVRLETTYAKKARGTVTATGEARPPEVAGPTDALVQATIRDEANDVVATVTATWRLDRA